MKTEFPQGAIAAAAAIKKWHFGSLTRGAAVVVILGDPGMVLLGSWLGRGVLLRDDSSNINTCT